MPAKKILLVDDEENIRNSFRRDFEHAGYVVTTAADGEEAVAKINSNNFDLIVTDLAMPGITGIDVLREAKKKDPETGTMILTGYGDMASAVEALRLGADDYLLKPCDAEELLLRSERFLVKQEAFRKVKLYENILPICMYCKSIRDDAGTEPGKGKWMKMEEYLHHKSAVDISHGCCPGCYEKFLEDSNS